MNTTLGPSPGHRKYRDHTTRVRPFAGRVTVEVDDETLAVSTRALQLDETGYERVFYLPDSDVLVDKLSRSDSRTHCPFKGEASYFAVRRDGALVDVAWTYPKVYDEVAPIAGYVAFYADRAVINTKSNPL